MYFDSLDQRRQSDQTEISHLRSKIAELQAEVATLQSDKADLAREIWRLQSILDTMSPQLEEGGNHA